MVSHVEKVPATRAFIASPSILAATFRALTGFLLFALIDVWSKEALKCLKQGLRSIVVQV